MTTAVVPSERGRSSVPRKTKFAVPPLNFSTDEQAYGVVESSDSIDSCVTSPSVMMVFMCGLDRQTSYGFLESSEYTPVSLS
jgi:hypothetical protein